MNRQQVTPPLDKAGHRADSPMREDARLATELPVNGNAPHGLPTPANDVPSSGFTAVNGDTHRYSSFRPDDSARPPMMGMTNGQQRPEVPIEQRAAPAAYHSHSWRPDERHYTHPDHLGARPESPGLNKRKRAGSGSNASREEARSDVQYSSTYQSPKRRMMALNASGLHAPDQPEQIHSYSTEGDELEPASTGPYVREHSPTVRWNAASPPPQPRPEVEAELAKSAQAFAATDKQPVPTTQGASPREGSSEHNQSQAHTPETGDAQVGDSADAKKRKRNFSNRTKTGCHTCRSRKKKCDEGKPICENCKRGAFDCGGYGPKPPGGSKISASRTNALIQAKPDFQTHSAAPFYDARHRTGSPRPSATHWESARPEHYGQSFRYPPPGPIDHRPQSAREAWGPRPLAFSGPEHPPHGMQDRFPPPEIAGLPPPPLGGLAPHNYPPDRGPPPGPWGHPQSLPPYRPPPAPPTVISSRESVSTSNSGGYAASLPGFPPHGPPSERTKMITGKPYKHFLDDELIRDRQSCRRAVEAYNDACAAKSTASPAEKERHFRSIIDPKARTFSETMVTMWQGPTGYCGSRTIVESPFNCEFGYNVHLGNDCVISSGCTMQDACAISLGDRTVVGPNVNFYCMTTSVDSSLRKGSQGTFMAGAIKIEEDCFIGADVIVLPFRTIGKGAVVGAGSVVTRDVKPYTVVAGNPAKVIRKRKIQPGPDVDHHNPDIQEENDKMLELMKTNQVVNRDRVLH